MDTIQGSDKQPKCPGPVATSKPGFWLWDLTRDGQATVQFILYNKLMHGL